MTTIKKIKQDSDFDINTGLPNADVGWTSDPLSSWYTPKGLQNSCLSCITPRKLSDYPIISKNATGVTDKNGYIHARYCWYCIPAIFDKFVTEYQGDKFKALCRLCAILDIYYDDTLAHKVLDGKETFQWDDESAVYETYHRALIYIKLYQDDKNLMKKSFFMNDNFNFDAIVEFQNSAENVAEMYLSEKDRKNRSTVIQYFHRDPFETEPIEDRPKLYEDLITISDETIAEDLSKSKAAIEIVRSYSRVDKISNTLQSLQANADTMLANEKSIKMLTDQKKAELDAIMKLIKDNNLSEKYSGSKGKGAGTLTAMIRDMNDEGYDPSTVNKFDIDTAEGMKQVADISISAMCKQLNFTQADYADMVKEQAVIIRSMQETMRNQKEQFRLLKEEYLRQELVERYRLKLQERNIDAVEIDKLVDNELQYVPYTGYEYNNAAFRAARKKNKEEGNE